MVKGEKITVRINTCVGCHTCELACAIEHSKAKDLLRAFLDGERPGHRIYIESFRKAAVPVPCNHCEEAACIAACPTGAAHRKTEGGPVFVDAEKCIGCAMCVQACPFGVIAMNDTGRTAYKCDVCVERRAKGSEPACVVACPTKSLSFGSVNTANKGKRQRVAEMMAEATAEGERELKG